MTVSTKIRERKISARCLVLREPSPSPADGRPIQVLHKEGKDEEDEEEVSLAEPTEGFFEPLFDALTSFIAGIIVLTECALGGGSIRGSVVRGCLPSWS
jgi:hypothetical protein